MFRLNRFVTLIILTFLLVVGVIVAQEVLQCDELIETFLEELAENCSEFSVNRACYGSNLVTAEFLNPDDLPENYFTEPSDIAELLRMSNLTTTVFDPEAPEWGIAVLNVQANIPNTIPGQAVKMLLMGAMEMENGVEPDEAFVSEHSIRLRLAENAVVRYLPRSDSDFVQTIPAASDVLADAKSTNSLWVRVAHDDIPGWIAVNTLTDTSRDRLMGLPMISEETQSAMQAFYFETGIGSTRCRQAPTVLVVQGPEDYAIDITANNAQIRVDSTIALRTRVARSGAVMEMVTLSGVARVFPDTEDEIVVPAGEIFVSCITSEERDLGIDQLVDDREVITCDARELTADEIAQYNFIRRVSSRVLNYAVVWPPEPLWTPTPTLTPTLESTETVRISPTAFACEPRADWLGIHVVASGQTVTGIASAYGTDALTLAAANCLVNPDLIIPGQTLIVPLAPTAIPVATNPPPPPPPAPTATPVPLVGDLQVLIAASNAAPLENDALNFTITVNNVGTQGMIGISISDTLNTLGVHYVFGAPSASTGTYTFATGTWTIPSLAGGSSASVVIPATVRPTAAGLAILANSSLTSPTDSNAANNTGSSTVSVGYGDIIVNANSTAIANDGVCTLREAITAANSDTASGNNIGECRTGNGADTIIMQAAGPYNVADAPFGGYAFPAITTDITLNANGNSIVQTAALAEMFSIQTGATVVINDLTLTDSVPAGTSRALLSFGNTTINNSTITGFRMDFGIPVAFGGGSTGVINNSNIIDNCGSGGGQLIWSDGSTGSITNSTVSDSGANACASGIRVNGNVTIDSTTISGHRWTGAPNGAGVYIDDGIGVGNAIIQNSTITNNRLGVHAATGGTANITGTDFTGTITDDCLIAGGTIISDGSNTTADPDCP